MPLYIKRKLSESVNGKGIEVSDSETLIHTTDPIIAMEEIWLYATNTLSNAAKCIIKFGDQTINCGLNKQDGLRCIIPGLVLQSGCSIKIYSNESSGIIIHGHVNSIIMVQEEDIIASGYDVNSKILLNSIESDLIVETKFVTTSIKDFNIEYSFKLEETSATSFSIKLYRETDGEAPVVISTNFLSISSENIGSTLETNFNDDEVDSGEHRYYIKINANDNSIISNCKLNIKEEE